MLEFPSTTTMVVLDLILFASSVFATIFVLVNWARLRDGHALPGLILVVLGVWVLSSIYIADFYAMTLMPLTTEASVAMAFMSKLHSVYNWYANTIAVLLILGGLFIFVSRVLQQADQTRLHQARLDQAAKIANLGYYIFDSASEKIEFCTEIHARNHGLTRDEYIKSASTLSNDMPLIHPEDREYVRQKYREVLEGKTVEIEYRVPTSSGEKRVREITRPVFDKDGKVVREIGTTIDVTEQYETEQILYRSQKFEAIGQLTGGVAHDFNNLLAVIMGNQEMLRDQIQSDSLNVEIANSLIDRTIEATSRGADLTQNMLAYARKAPLIPKPVDLNQVVKETEKWVRRTIESRIEIENILQAGLWPTLVDRTSLQSALVNLLVNARDAIDGSGCVTVETRNIHVETEYLEGLNEDIPPGRYVMLAVTDNGSGMSPEIIDQIFDPFYSTKPVGKGSGLGLSMVQGFVKQSGGAIRVYSEVGTGTCFKIFFAATPDDSPESKVQDEEPYQIASERSGKRVLLVEDQEDVLAVMEKTLIAGGFDLVTANSGDEAFAILCDDNQFDLVLTDIVMPGKLQGPSLAREIRKIYPDIRFIFISGYASETTFHGNGLKPDDVRLMKPISRSNLLKAVETAVSDP